MTVTGLDAWGRNMDTNRLSADVRVATRDSDMIETYLSLRQVAAAISVHKATIQRAVARGDFPQPYRIGKSALRWKETEVQAYLNASRVTKGAA